MSIHWNFIEKLQNFNVLKESFIEFSFSWILSLILTAFELKRGEKTYILQFNWINILNSENNKNLMGIVSINQKISTLK